MKAFPVTDQHNSNINEGMDLRDYFAAKAMQGMLCEGYVPEQKVNYQYYNGTFHDMYAEQAYKIADAMMKAREQ